MGCQRLTERRAEVEGTCTSSCKAWRAAPAPSGEPLALERASRRPGPRARGPEAVTHDGSAEEVAAATRATTGSSRTPPAGRAGRSAPFRGRPTGSPRGNRAPAPASGAGRARCRPGRGRRGGTWRRPGVPCSAARPKESRLERSRGCWHLVRIEGQPYEPAEADFREDGTLDYSVLAGTRWQIMKAHVPSGRRHHHQQSAFRIQRRRNPLRSGTGGNADAGVRRRSGLVQARREAGT